MPPEGYAELLVLALGDGVELRELFAVVVDEGLGQVLVGVADGVPAVPEAVSLDDPLDVEEPVLPDRVEGDGVRVAGTGEAAERRILAEALEYAGVGDAPGLPVPPLVQLDEHGLVQEDDEVRRRVAVHLSLLDGDLAERPEDVPEIGGQVVQDLGLRVGALDLRRREHRPRQLLGVALLVERQGQEQGAGEPAVGVFPIGLIEDLHVEGIEDLVALPCLLHGVRAVAPAACRGVDPLLGDLVLEHEHGVVANPVEEPPLVLEVVQGELPVGEVGAELPAVVAPLPEPVAAPPRGIPVAGGLLGIRGGGIGRITR